MPLKTLSRGVQGYVRQDGTIGSYFIQYRDEDGRNIKVKVDAATQREAEDELHRRKRTVRQIKQDRANGITRLRQRMADRTLTLDQMADLFYEGRTTANNEQDRRRYELYISPTLGSKMVANITRRDIRSLQGWLASHTFTKAYGRRTANGALLSPETFTLAPKTVNNIIDHLRAIFNEGMDEDNMWCDHNPVKVKKLPVESEPGRVLSDDELDLLWRVLREGDYDLGLPPHPTLYLYTKLLYHTGARPAAILPLKVSDIDDAVRIKALKGGRSYKAKLKPETMALVKEWISTHSLGRHDCLFYSQQGVRRGTSTKASHMAQTVLSKASRRYFDPLFNTDEYGIIEDKRKRVMLYSLRRTAATKIYKAFGIVEAKNFLRHTDIKTTMYYLNIGEDDMAGVIDAL